MMTMLMDLCAIPLLAAVSLSGALVACNDDPGMETRADADEVGGDATGDGDTDVQTDLADDGPPGDEPDVFEDPPSDGPRVDLFDLGEEPDGFESTLVIEDLVLVENATNVLSFLAEWSTAEPASTELRVVCADEYDERFESGLLTTDHEVLVLGLLAGASCTVFVQSRTAAGTFGTAEATYDVGALPGQLPQLAATVADGAELQRGWTLFNLNNSFDNVPLYVAMVDEQGRYRWYHRRAAPGSGSDNDVRTFRNGVLIGGRGQAQPPAYVRWSGELIWEGDFSMHHDIRPHPDGDHFMFLQDAGAEACPQPFGSSRAVIIEWATGVETWSYRLCEHYDPIAEVGDWLHANTLTPFPDEDAILLSSRNQNSLFKIDVESGDVVWVLGLGGRPADGFNGDFDITDDDRFYQQHDPEFQPNGNLLLFDNGIDSRGFSRAIELAYDEGEMTAEVVWEYRHDPDIYAPIWGDADRLRNGNRLVTFGRRAADQASLIVEVTSDAAPQLLWELTTPNGWGFYRAERVVDPLMGRVVNDD